MITKRDLAFAASRLLSLYLMLQVAMSLLGLPVLASAFAMTRSVDLNSRYRQYPLHLSYWTLSPFITMAVHAVFYILGAILFWKCGPGVERIFTRPSEEM